LLFAGASPWRKTTSTPSYC